jgi:cyanophycinase
MVMTDPMVDPRGGAFTLGLGLIEQLAIIPHYDTWSHEKAHRTIQLAPHAIPVVGVDEQTALLREPGGGWRVSGAGTVSVFLDRSPADLGALPG